MEARARYAVSLVLVLGACTGHARDAALADPALAWRLPQVRRALGRDAGSATLRYEVLAHDGRWAYDIVVDRERYAERRRRLDGRASYAFGVDAVGGWLRVGERGEALEADAAWVREARTRAAVLGLAFTRPRRLEEAVFVGLFGERWELAYRPHGGRTVTVSIDSATSLPRAFDAHDDFGRISACDDLRWARAGGRTVLARARCWTIAGERHRRAETELRLVGLTTDRAGTLPRWALAEPRRPLRPLRLARSFPLTEPLRPAMPVTFGDTPAPVSLLLDSGATHTTLSAELARAIGVVPTGEAPLYVRPPWLPDNDLWVGVVPRMRVGDAELHGVRVWVAEDSRGIEGSGLLGLDFFRRYVVDLDSPNGALVLRPRDGWRPPPGHALLRARGLGRSLQVRGEVVGVEEGSLIVDTGASLGVVVHSPLMATVHPRSRGSEIQLGVARDVGRSPDYVAEIAGLRFGPYSLPAMPAIGRDRERERLGGAVALVGMGVLRHFRLSFDVGHGWLYAWPGDSYGALVRAGVELVDADEGAGARVERVLCDGGCALGGLEPGDVLERIGRARVADARVARRLLVASERSTLAVTVERAGRSRALEIDLADLPEPGAERTRAPDDEP